MTMDDVQRSFADVLHSRGAAVTAGQLEQFEFYYRELVAWNEKVNLTGITERNQVYIKHFYDSVTLSFYLPFEGSVTLADIGSGAGFPGIPLKILHPGVKLTIVDSLQKRIRFLEHLTDTLGLTDVVCLHGRAEELARDPALRDAFDIVTARAVARMNVLNEFCLPFVKRGGWFAAMKGADPQAELTEAIPSIKALNARLETVHRLELPQEMGERHIVLLKKTGETPKKFPRKPGVPLKQPIV